METTLHRQLKLHYAPDVSACEVTLGSYRIDVMGDGELIEIQHGSLAAIRDKVADLLGQHRVRVVKPIVIRKRLVKLQRKGGAVVSRRLSPKLGSRLDLFHELVYFTRVFPHANLTLDVPLVDIEEWRYPGHGRRRRWRENDFQVEDQRLETLHETIRLTEPADLLKLLDVRLPAVFHTSHLAESLGISRWIAQRIAYTLRETGAVHQVGKQGNLLLYEAARDKQKPKRRRVARKVA
ncbi:MAG: hypothetical protein KDA71_07410 [Planctomycetales bacterium]|nr:hypothetical protein [Planctomycetales bacterium]